MKIKFKYINWESIKQLSNKFGQGEVGKKADNLIQHQFEATKPMEKCYTDVTEFAIPASSQKLYLSPVLDGFNSEVIVYIQSFYFAELSTSKNDIGTSLHREVLCEHYSA